MMFYHKGIKSNLVFCSEAISLLYKIIDVIYDHFDITNSFPEFEIILHPNYYKDKNESPETRKGYIMLSTDCENGIYVYYQQIAWQFSHELVHVCKGFIEKREEWIYLPDNDEEEILAGGIAILIVNNLCPTYDYKKKYSKSNLEQCEEKAKEIKELIIIR